MRSSLHATLLAGLAGVLSMATACGDDTTATTSGLGGSGGGSGGSDATTSSQAGPGPGSTSSTQAGPTSSSTQAGPTSTASSSTGGDGGDPTGGGGDPTGGGGDPTGGGGDPTGGGGDPTGGGGDPTGGGGNGGDGTTAATTVAASTAQASTAQASTSTGGDLCTAVTLDDLQFVYGLANPLYVSDVSPEIDGADEDLIGMFLFDDTDGTFDLADEGDLDVCNRCVLGNIDNDPDTGAPTKTFYQESGTFTLAAVGNDALNGNATFTLANVTLVEVTVDDVTGQTTPVPGGDCLFLAAATFNDPVPAAWTCDPSFYEDQEFCDCECGAYDPDCDDDALPIDGCTAGQTCEPPTGTCQGGGGVPAGWTCADADALDSFCDCGCGALDPACDDATAASCEFCPADSCANDGSPFGCDDASIDPDENFLCVGGGDTFTVDSGAIVFTIPDNVPAGACVNITGNTAGTVALVDSIQVAATHTWIGDLVFRVIAPDGTSVVFLDRPGTTAGGGDSSNLLAANPVTFQTGAAVPAENMGNTIGDNQVVCLNDATCTFAPHNSFAPYTDSAANGTWQFCAADNAGLDTGSVSQVVINGTLQ